MFIKPILTCLLFLFISSFSVLQPNPATLPVGDGYSLTGKWCGTLTQKQNGLASRYKFEMVLEQNNDRVNGTSTIATEGEQPEYGIMLVEGTFKDGELKFTELRIVNKKLRDAAYWCIKKGALELKLGIKKEELKGKWWGCVSQDADEPEGRIEMEKVVETK